LTRVLVAADSAVARKGLEGLVRSSDLLHLVGSTSIHGVLHGDEVDELHSDAILLEWRQSGEEFLSAVSEFPSGAEAPAIVILTSDEGAAWVEQAMRSGAARAVLSQDSSAEEIIAAVYAAGLGFAVLRAERVKAAVHATTGVHPRPSETPHQALSPREREVLAMLAEGLGNKEVAWRLKISEHTVKFHVNSIFQKLNASSRTEAVTTGIRFGLISI
jgi:two-component system, NarL family, response regulator YdfI